MQPSRIHHVGLPVSDLDRSVAWYREALGLTHESTAGVPEGVAFMVAPTGERLELLAVDPQPSAWDGPYAPASPTSPGQLMTSTPPTRVRWRRAAARSGTRLQPSPVPSLAKSGSRAGPPHQRRGSLLKGGRGGSVSQPLDLAIVAHCVDVDPQNVPDSSRDPEGGRFRTGRDHDRKPRVGVADFLGRHSPQQLAV
jgi:catechol 2,3-dioxygenase-like lactoylglutathione lyase family enzyme